MRSHLHDLRGLRGASLVETLIALAVMSIVTLAAVEVYRKSVDIKMASQMRRARAEVRSMITSKVDCKRTLQPYGEPPSCNGARIPLRKGNGTVIVASPSSTLGDVFVRATCGVGEIRVEIAHRAQSGGFAKDPFDRTTPLGWSHPARMLFPGLGLCTGEFASTPAPKIYTQTFFPVLDPANTSRGATAWSRTITVPYPVRSAMGAVDGSHATNSSLGCLHNMPVISGNSVTFSGQWWHGNHLHQTGCSLSYIISAE